MPAIAARVRLVHPFPSLVNSALVFALALIAGGEALRAGQLAVAMLGLQFCIGIVNDLVDEPIDALAKPWKPLPAGLISRRTAAVAAAVCGGGGLLLAAPAGAPVLAMYVAMLGCGLVYDFWLKPTAWAWLCFSIAFVILPVYAWYGAAAGLPPRSEFLLPLAALAGPIIQLSNGLADIDRDRAVGVRTLAARLGQRRSVIIVGLLIAIIHLLAWLTLPGAAVTAATLLAAAATLLAVAGLALSAARRPMLREAGWMTQAASIALLGLGWVSAAVA